MPQAIPPATVLNLSLTGCSPPFVILPTCDEQVFGLPVFGSFWPFTFLNFMYDE